MTKRVIVIFAAVAAILVSFSLFFTYLCYKPLALPEAGVTVIIEPGSSLKKIALALEAADVIQNPYAFILLARIKNDALLLQAGEYFFPAQTNLVLLLDKMVRGDVVMHSIRLNEGWTFAEIAVQITANEALLKTLDWSKPDTILQQLNLSEHKPEGLLYPDTYFFPRGYSDAELVRHTYARMQTFLQQAWQGRAKFLPYQDAYQALIAASIIEKETAVATEREIVSGVIMRRLQKGMLLQVDPTVVYGLGAHYDQALTKADLHVDTPYNTYLHVGLPPTPIATVSPDSILAALHPAAGDALYFVARGDGSHRFSATLLDHNQAVADYRKQQAGK